MSPEQTGPRPAGAATEFAPAEFGAGWLEGELAQARQLLTALGRELVDLRGEVAHHRGELSAIEQGLATVSGRTERQNRQDATDRAAAFLATL